MTYKRIIILFNIRYKYKNQDRDIKMKVKIYIVMIIYREVSEGVVHILDSSKAPNQYILPHPRIEFVLDIFR